MNIFDFETAGGKNLIKDFINQLPVAERTVAYSMREKIQLYGMKAFDGFNIRQLHKKLWEIKFSSNRFLYVIIDCNNLYFVHAFKKKGRTEKNELNKAVDRVRELEKITGMKLV